MIQIVPQMHIVLAVEPIDFRNGIDGLARICRHKLQADPFAGWLFECPLDCTHPRGKRKPPSTDHPSLSPPERQAI